jgi:predicted PhzF superfamily epimerase YddE/YHI9
MIEQGIEMKRPSRIYIRGIKDGDRVSNVRIGGSAIKIFSGEAEL